MLFQGALITALHLNIHCGTSHIWFIPSSHPSNYSTWTWDSQHKKCKYCLNISKLCIVTAKFSFIKIQAEMRFFVGYCYFFSSNFAILQSWQLEMNFNFLQDAQKHVILKQFCTNHRTRAHLRKYSGFLTF